MTGSSRTAGCATSIPGTDEASTVCWENVRGPPLVPHALNANSTSETQRIVKL
jgi:hypothetical protein